MSGRWKRRCHGNVHDIQGQVVTPIHLDDFVDSGTHAQNIGLVRSVVSKIDHQFGVIELRFDRSRVTDRRGKVAQSTIQGQGENPKRVLFAYAGSFPVWGCEPGQTPDII
jgi:hypothetical protein